MGLFDLFDALLPRRVQLDDATALAAVTTTADPQRGVIVLVHGFTGSKEDFVLVQPDLAALGWSTVAYDARGTFESTGAAPFTRGQLARDLVTVARWAAAERGVDAVHVVGHSYGGLVAQEAVARHPDAFASLTLMCSGPAGVAVVGAQEQAITIGRAHDIVELLTQHDVEAAWDIKAAFEGLDMTNPFARFLRQRFVTTDRESMLQAARDLLASPDLVPGVLATGVPVRWCFGAGDGSWSQSNQRASAARYGTSAHVIPAPAMHSPCIENDEATTAWLDQTLGALSDVEGRSDQA